MEEKIMLTIATSFMIGMLFGLILSWICTSNESELMVKRIKKLERDNEWIYKELMDYIKKDIENELRDE